MTAFLHIASHSPVEFIIFLNKFENVNMIKYKPLCDMSPLFGTLFDLVIQ